MVYEKCGHSWSTKDGSGETLEIVHDCWIPIRHLYSPPALGSEEEGIRLFRGEFQIGDAWWDGEVHFDTRKHPETIASGFRTYNDLAELVPAGIELFFSEPSGWQEPCDLLLSGVVGVPAPPSPQDAESAEPGDAPGQRVTGHPIGEGAVGDGSHLDRLTFLVPNGRRVSDGLSVCDEGRLKSGVLFVEAEGWAVRIDPRTDVSQKEVSERQRATAAHIITHVGEIRKVDGSSFSSAEATDILEIISTSLTLFLGRATACVLPVGWRSSTALWARWGGSRSIDRRESDFAWFDDAEGAASLAELIRRCLTVARRDDGMWDVVQLAIGYLLSAHRGTVQMRVSLPVAAISLLAEEWKVSFAPPGERVSRASMSKTGAADRIRLMLDVISASPDVPVGLTHLAEVQQAIQHSASASVKSGDSSPGAAPTAAEQEELVDAVKCLITLRNEVEHPGKRRTIKRDVRQWAEAGFFATDALLLSVLYLVRYEGTYLPLASERRGAGGGRLVPWSAESIDQG